MNLPSNIKLIVQKSKEINSSKKDSHTILIQGFYYFDGETAMHDSCCLDMQRPCTILKTIKKKSYFRCYKI